MADEDKTKSSSTPSKVTAERIAKLRNKLRITKQYQERSTLAMSSPEKFTDIFKIGAARGLEKFERQWQSMLGPAGEAIYQARRAKPGQKYQAVKNVLLQSLAGGVGRYGIIGETLANKLRQRVVFPDDPEREIAHIKQTMQIVGQEFEKTNDIIQRIRKDHDKTRQQVDQLTTAVNQAKRDIQNDTQGQFAEVERKLEDSIKPFERRLTAVEGKIEQLSSTVDKLSEKGQQQKSSGGQKPAGGGFDISSLLGGAAARSAGGFVARAATAAVSNPLVLGAAGLAYLAYRKRRAIEENPEGFKEFQRKLGGGGARAEIIEGPESELKQYGPTAPRALGPEALLAQRGYTKEDVKSIRGNKITLNDGTVIDTVQDQPQQAGPPAAKPADKQPAAKPADKQPAAKQPPPKPARRGLFGLGGFPTQQQNNFFSNYDRERQSQQQFGQSFDRQMIEREKSQFLQFGQLPKGFEFLPGQMGRLGSPEAVAATGAMPLGGYGEVAGVPGMPRGGYSTGGGNAAGSTTGPVAGGGAESTLAGGEPLIGPLKDVRAKLFADLSNPTVKAAVLARMQIEVGIQGPQAQQAWLESVANRAAARGLSLYDAVSNKDGYYPRGDDRKWQAQASRGVTKQLENKYEGIVASVAGGSNIANFATGNASGMVGFGQGRAVKMPDGSIVAPGQTASYGGERFGVEKLDKKWVARAKRAEEEAKKRATTTGTQPTGPGSQPVGTQPTGTSTTTGTATTTGTQPTGTSTTTGTATTTGTQPTGPGSQPDGTPNASPTQTPGVIPAPPVPPPAGAGTSGPSADATSTTTGTSTVTRDGYVVPGGPKARTLFDWRNYQECATLGKAFNPAAGRAGGWKGRIITGQGLIQPGVMVATTKYNDGSGGKPRGQGYHTAIALTAPDGKGNFLVLDQYRGSGGARVRTVNVNNYGNIPGNNFGVVKGAQASNRQALELALSKTTDPRQRQQIQQALDNFKQYSDSGAATAASVPPPAPGPQGVTPGAAPGLQQQSTIDVPSSLQFSSNQLATLDLKNTVTITVPQPNQQPVPPVPQPDAAQGPQPDAAQGPQPDTDVQPVPPPDPTQRLSTRARMNQTVAGISGTPADAAQGPQPNQQPVPPVPQPNAARVPLVINPGFVPGYTPPNQQPVPLVDPNPMGPFGSPTQSANMSKNAANTQIDQAAINPPSQQHAGASTDPGGGGSIPDPHHPETAPPSPGSGGQGSYGRCFV